MKQKIAIVEDETAIAEMYKLKLEQAGFEVGCATNGREGLALIKTFQPTLILLDLMMPEMSGEEMLEKLRASDWGKTIRVIILTNISEEAKPVKLPSLNISRYIIKANYTPGQVAAIASEVLSLEKQR